MGSPARKAEAHCEYFLLTPHRRGDENRDLNARTVVRIAKVKGKAKAKPGAGREITSMKHLDVDYMI